MMPKIGKIGGWFRDRIINHLDRNPDYCWASLVVWSLGYHSFLSLFIRPDEFTSKTCSGDFAYCGKCYKTGRLPRPKPE